jgi:CO/xanthine dehydrogenase FAD-binding subunit
VRRRYRPDNVRLRPSRPQGPASRGKALDESAIKQAAELAAQAAEPSADLRGSVEYKKDLVRVLTARALRKAVERAGSRR